MTTFIPVGANILVRPLEDFGGSRFVNMGFYLPEQTRTPLIVAEVLAFNDYFFLENEKTGKLEKIWNNVQIGDRVVIYRNEGTAIEFDGEWLAIVQEQDILAAVD